MEIKYKLYPYPVLSTFSNDYKEGAYSAEISVERDGYNLRLKFLSQLTSGSLLDCIHSGLAKYVYHIECAQTGYRKVIKTDKAEDTYVIEHKSVNGKIQICAFVVAVEDIKNFTSPDFHEDYQGLSFDIEAGCVIAVGGMTTVDVSKDIDDLADTPSIFNIIKNTDENCKEMLVDMSQRKIIIKLPLSDFYSYKALSTNPLAQPILNSLTIIPALTYVLEELKALPVQERIENSDTLWYKVIAKVLYSQFQCDVEDEAFNNQNMIVLAQKLINNPVSDAFTFLSSSFSNSGGEE